MFNVISFVSKCVFPAVDASMLEMSVGYNSLGFSNIKKKSILFSRTKNIAVTCQVAFNFRLFIRRLFFFASRALGGLAASLMISLTSYTFSTCR